MAFQVSPGVNWSEIDLTTTVPGVSTSAAAFVAAFQWGPVDEITSVDSESTLKSIFGGPGTSYNSGDTSATSAEMAINWMTAASFLAYSNNLYVVRVVGSSAKNAAVNNTSIIVKNADDYDVKYDDDTLADTGQFIAKYPGTKGNSLSVVVCSNTQAYSNTLTGLYANSDFSSDTDNIIIRDANDGTYANIEEWGASVNDYLEFTDSSNLTGMYKISSIDSTGGNVSITPALNTATTDLSNNTIKLYWEHYRQFSSAPGTSEYASSISQTNDEQHILVMDEDGAWTGTRNTILEKFEGVSTLSGAKREDGSSNYIKNVINQESSYIWFGSNTVSQSVTTPQKLSLTGGVDDNSNSSIKNERALGYELFNDKDATDIGLVIMGTASYDLIQNVIDNVALERLDCVVCLSPESADTVGVTTQSTATSNIIDFKDTVNRSTSYAIMDSGHKKMYDKYNDTYRFVPLNGDIAGLIAQVEQNRDAWFSPAGYVNGQIKNAVSLAFNPSKTQRDRLYPEGINPVIAPAGEGIILFGDKTMLARSSAFNRINVRRLFIVLEKAISRAAKDLLFEFNDIYTRKRFVNMVEPFLADVKGRRGIYDYRIVCDESNNTGEVIDRNEFVGDIYIKPARTINYMQLNFVAVKTDVDFNEAIISG